MKKSTEEFTEWHRRFAELFEALFSTGYLADYSVKPTHAVRYLPVGEVIEAIPTALPSDRLEDILDHYDKFSIATCQCRSSKKLLGEDCGRMIEVCTAFGDIAGWLANAGKATLASKQDVLEVKAAAERKASSPGCSTSAPTRATTARARAVGAAAVRCALSRSSTPRA